MQRFYLGAVLALATSLIVSAGASASHGSRPAGQDPQLTRVAVTQAFNVAIVNGNGGARRVVTSRGTGYNGIWYSRYAWSFDGKYLLLVKNTVEPAKSTRTDLLLLDANGAVLRTLATIPQDADFPPQWAQDSDQIAYVAWHKVPANYNRLYNAVNVVDLQGHKRGLWGYWSTAEGCGGGTGDPAAQLFWQETGLGGIPQSVVWNVSRHIAIYSPSCAGGLALTDLRTRKSRLLGISGQQWNEAALSRSGVLAAAIRTCAQTGVCTSHITLVNTASGQVVRNAGNGGLPTWSPDGKTLYFVREDVVKHLPLEDALGNKGTADIYSSSIWRANADGTHALKLVSEDAYSLGPLQITPDGASLIYTKVDNDTGLYTHRLANGRYNDAILKLYGPRTTVERFDSGHRPVPVVINASRPVVQP